MPTKDIIYFNYSSKEPSCYKVDGDSIVDISTKKVTAFVEDNIWFSCATCEPIAFEEDGIVFTYSSRKPILFRDDA